MLESVDIGTQSVDEYRASAGEDAVDALGDPGRFLRGRRRAALDPPPGPSRPKGESRPGLWPLAHTLSRCHGQRRAFNKRRHKLLLFRTNLPANALPLRSDGNVDEESPLLHSVADSGNQTAPGDYKSVPTKEALTPGHYVAVCNLPGHYHLGMCLNINVVPAAAPPGT